MKKIGIVGTGKRIGVANDHLLGIQAVPEWRLEAVYDLKRENAEDFVGKHQLSERVLCKDLNELLDRVDAVSVCTDNHTHAEIVRRAFEKKVHVLCEKPLSTTYQEAVQLAKEAEEMEVVHYMGMQYRYHPYAQAIKELIDSDVLGEIVFYRHRIGGARIGNSSLELEWRMKKETSGAGAIADFGVHQFDLLSFFLRDTAGPLRKVQTELGTFIKNRPQSDSISPGEVTNDDVSAIIGKLENGAIVNLNNSRILPPDGHGLEIVGRRAAIWMDQNENVFLRRQNDQGRWENERTPVSIEKRHQFSGLARGRQYQEFYDIIDKSIPYELDFHYGAEMLGLVEKAIEAQNHQQK
ncbi:Gfo/Idh/MocA family protein [Alteribacillus sp. HJP-4]|uniref:Gfo/Idh/MocA family protein n=1 Tax=Alteribacillus sp. HJP-4 TaxID=2775394 RepID=UPI0035CCF2CD